MARQIDTNRFCVIDLPNGKYGVLDTELGKRVGYSYSNPPLYRNEVWNSYYAARGFSQKLAAAQSPYR